MKRYYNHTDEHFIHLNTRTSPTIKMYGQSGDMMASDFAEVIEVALGRRTAFVSEAAYKATLEFVSLIAELGTILLGNGVGAVFGVNNTETKMVIRALEENLAPWDRSASLRARRIRAQM